MVISVQTFQAGMYVGCRLSTVFICMDIDNDPGPPATFFCVAAKRPERPDRPGMRQRPDHPQERLYSCSME